MTQPLIRIAYAALLAALVPHVADAASALPRDAQVIDAERIPAAASASARERAAAALAAVRTGDGDAAIAALSGLAPLPLELAAADVLAALQDGARSPAAERVLGWIATQPVRLYRRHEETAADWFLPVFDLPSRVESVRRVWTMNEDRERWQSRWNADPAATLAALPAAGAPQRQRAVEAIAGLPAARLDGLRRTLGQQAQKRRAVPADVMVAVAKRAPDHASLAAALAVADEAAVLDLLPIAAAALPARDLVDWLDALAAAHPALASAATLALAAPAATEPAAERRLLQWLDDPHRGASAAAAIARLPVADRVGWIDAVIARETRPRAVSRLLLALRLDGTPAALASEQRWRGDDRIRVLLPAEARP